MLDFAVVPAPMILTRDRYPKKSCALLGRKDKSPRRAQGTRLLSPSFWVGGRQILFNGDKSLNPLPAKYFSRIDVSFAVH
jgi:hypothetical protein